MKPLPTIESLFSVFVQTQYSGDLLPIQEEGLRRAFFCGFYSCLQSIDILAEITHSDQDAAETQWQLLHAELEKFATKSDCGEKSVNH